MDQCQQGKGFSGSQASGFGAPVCAEVQVNPSQSTRPRGAFFVDARLSTVLLSSGLLAQLRMHCSVLANLGAVYEDNVNGVVGLSVLETYQYLGGNSVNSSMYALLCFA